MALSFARPKTNDKDIVKKAKSAVTRTSIKGGSNLVTQIQSMTAIAEAKLKHHKEDYILIQTMDSLKNYINSCVINGECALDTETTGLNPLTIDLVGVC